MNIKLFVKAPSSLWLIVWLLHLAAEKGNAEIITILMTYDSINIDGKKDKIKIRFIRLFNNYLWQTPFMAVKPQVKSLFQNNSF